MLPTTEDHEQMKFAADKNVGLWAIVGTVLAGISLYFITGMMGFYYFVSKELPVISTKLDYLQVELASLKTFAQKGGRFTSSDGERLRRDLTTYINTSIQESKKRCNDIATRVELMQQRGQYHLESHFEEKHLEKGAK